MDKQPGLWLLTLLFLAANNFSSAEDKNAYFKVGGEIKLRPAFSKPITNILWKLKGDLVAEWIKDTVPLVYYGRFLHRTKLELTDGTLVLKNTTKADEGLYTVEINNVVQDTRYIVKAIEDVPKPEVWIRPVVCNADMDSCTLTCGATHTEEAEPITYMWKEDDGGWENKEKVLVITGTGTANVKTYSCQMKNPVSEKNSEPKHNPFYKEPEPGSSTVEAGLVVLVVLGVLSLFGIVALFAFKKRKYIMELCCKNTGGSEMGNRENASPSGGTHEELPLNKSPRP